MRGSSGHLVAAEPFVEIRAFGVRGASGPRLSRGHSSKQPFELDARLSIETIRARDKSAPDRAP